MNKNILIFIMCLLVISIALSPIVSAKYNGEDEIKRGHIHLLAVSEGTEQGSLADLYLEIRPGYGNVYIDTFPLTKMDTQLSTRFAKQVACNFLNKDCSKYDFFYTIKAGSSIIGGPSAGAASAMLTVALLEGNEFDETVTITGTINTGGIIGNVGGIKAKIEAAATNNITKVLVPIGSAFVLNETKLNNTYEEIIQVISNKNVNGSGNGSNSNNESILNNTQGETNNVNETDNVIDIINISQRNVSDKVDLVEFGNELGIEVIEVLTLRDALKEFTGKEYEKPAGEIQLEEFYIDTMNKIGEEICSRTKELENKLFETIEAGEGVISKEDLVNISSYNQSMELIKNAELAIELNQTYAAASYCFGANINLDNLILLNANLTEQKKIKKLNELIDAINNSNVIIDEMNLTSFNDLQTFLIVKERLIEAFNTWERAIEAANENKTNLEYEIAYVTERLFSAYSWSYFFNTTDDEFVMDEEVMKGSCQTIVNEAQERLEYFKLLYPYPLPLLDSTSKEIDRALTSFNNNKFRICLMHASKAKSEIDAVLSTINLEDDELQRLLDAKLELVEQVILEQQLKGLFPIQGYSYYEYAKALGENDKVSGLIYSQYALEFSNLNLYFERIEEVDEWDVFIDYLSEFFNVKTLVAFIIGFVCASFVFIGYLFVKDTKKQVKKADKKNLSMKKSSKNIKIKKNKKTRRK